LGERNGKEGRKEEALLEKKVVLAFCFAKGVDAGLRRHDDLGKMEGLGVSLLGCFASLAMTKRGLVMTNRGLAVTN